MASSIWSRVLVGTDGSPTAQRAVDAAGQVARALGVPITVATGWYRDHLDEMSEMTNAHGDRVEAGATNSSWATDVVVDAAATLRTAGCEDVHTATPEGGPADALVKLSDEHPDTLVVVGTVGLGSTTERLLGNVPHQLTHHAHADLLLVSHADYATSESWKTVALATDGSATAGFAVDRGIALVAALGATSTLLTVATSEDRGLRAFEKTPAPTDDTRVAVGRDVASTLTEAAADFDLLVLGNKGMSGPSRLLGSVANSVTHHLPTDLLLVNTTR